MLKHLSMSEMYLYPGFTLSSFTKIHYNCHKNYLVTFNFYMEETLS